MLSAFCCVVPTTPELEGRLRLQFWVCFNSSRCRNIATRSCRASLTCIVRVRSVVFLRAIRKSGTAAAASNLPRLSHTCCGENVPGAVREFLATGAAASGSSVSRCVSPTLQYDCEQPVNILYKNYNQSTPHTHIHIRRSAPCALDSFLLLSTERSPLAAVYDYRDVNARLKRVPCLVC